MNVKGSGWNGMELNWIVKKLSNTQLGFYCFHTSALILDELRKIWICYTFSYIANNKSKFYILFFRFSALPAMIHLDKLRIWGKSIRVMASKHQAVQLPKEGQPDAGLTRDYAQNPLHRFKKPGSKNYQNIYPPSATLHLSNIP